LQLFKSGLNFGLFGGKQAVDLVEFEVEKGPKGPQATNVMKL